MDKAAKPLKIFISYGHEIGAVDDNGIPYPNPNNESVVLKIKAYLESRGHEIWLDKDKIKPGNDWRKAIYNGVEWSDVALICLSRRAMRLNGVCRDEIFIAMGVRGGNMFPVKLEVLEDDEYPAYLLNRKLFSKFQNWRVHCTEDNIDEAWLDENLETLAQSLEEENVWRYGVEMVELKKLLKPWNMNSRLRSLDRGSQYLYNDETEEYEKKTVHKFCGRESLFKLFADKESQEANQESERILWLKKGPGFGKSRFAAELLYRYYFAISAAFFVEYNLEESHKAQTFIKSVAFQLAQTNSSYRERLLGVLRANPDEINRQLDNPDKLFKTLVIDLLEKENDEDKSAWILVDALDEATENNYNEIASLISGNIDNLPPWIRFYITSRDNDNAVNQNFKDITPIDFEDEENVNDILEYIRSEFSALGLSVSEELINILLEKSEGTFLYPEMVFRDLEKNAFTVDDIRDLPKGVIGYIHAQFERLFEDKLESYNTEIRPWLGYVLTSCEPIPRGVLKYALGIREDSELERRLNLLGTFFVQSGSTDEDTVAPFHKSVIDYCFNKNVSFIFYVDPDEAKKHFAQTGCGLYESGALQWIKRTDETPDIAQRYFLNWQPSHLMNANMKEDAASVLSDFAFLMKRLRYGNVERVLQDYILFRDALKGVSQASDAYFDVICSNAHYLRRNREDNPAYKTMLQIATEVADDCPVTQAAERWLNPEEGESPCDWFWLNKVKRLSNYRSNPCKLVIEHAGDYVILLSNGNALSCGEGNYLRIWNLETGECIAVLRGHTSRVSGAIELQSGVILSWSEDKTLRLWSPDGTCKAVLEGHTDHVNDAIELSSGDILSWCGGPGCEDYAMRLWTPDGTCKALLKGHTKSVRGAIELNSGNILSWSWDHTLRLWFPDGICKAVLEGHTSMVKCALELRCGDILSWSWDHTLRIWSSDGICKKILKGHTSRVNGALELRSGDILSWSDDNALRIWSPDGECKAILEGHTGWVIDALELRSGDILSWSMNGDLRLWSPDGAFKTVLEGHSGIVNGAIELRSGDILSWNDDHTLRIWSSDGICKAVLVGHTRRVKDAIELDSSKILSWSGANVSWFGDGDHTMRLWSPDVECKAIQEEHANTVGNVIELRSGDLLSRSGGLLCKDNTLRLWTPDETCKAVLEGHTDWLWDAIELSSGDILSWSWDHTLRLWSPDGACKKVLEGHPSSVKTAKELRSGDILSLSDDGTLLLWTSDGTFKEVLVGHSNKINDIIELRSGDILTCSSDKTLRIWSPDGICKAILEGHTGSVEGAIELRSGDILSWSHNLFLYHDHALRIWSPDGTCKAILEGHTDGVKGAIELSSSDIASWSDDKTLRIWSPDGTCKEVLEGYTDVIKDVKELRSGDILSWSDDRSMRLWSPDGTCKEIIDYDNPQFYWYSSYFFPERVHEQFYAIKTVWGIQLQHDFKHLIRWNSPACDFRFVGGGRICVWYGRFVKFLQLNYGNHMSISFDQVHQFLAGEIDESKLVVYAPKSKESEVPKIEQESTDASETKEDVNENSESAAKPQNDFFSWLLGLFGQK